MTADSLAPPGSETVDEPDDQVVGPLNTFDRTDSLEVGFWEGVGEVDVGRVMGDDPEVGVHPIDRHRALASRPMNSPTCT